MTKNSLVLMFFVLFFLSCEQNPPTVAMQELAEDQDIELLDAFQLGAPKDSGEKKSEKERPEWSTSFHTLFTQSRYKQKVFIDRHTGKTTAVLDRDPENPVDFDGEKTSYRLGELNISGGTTRSVLVDKKDAPQKLHFLESGQTLQENKSRHDIRGFTTKQVSQFVYNWSRDRMREADANIVVENGQNPLIFGPRQPIEDYYRLFCDQNGECIQLDVVQAKDSEYIVEDVYCLPCDTLSLHTSSEDLTIDEVLASNLTQQLPGSEKTFLDLIHEEKLIDRELPDKVKDLFMKGLPALESSFDPDALSTVKASGIWQLMPSYTYMRDSIPKRFVGKQDIFGKIYAEYLGGEKLDMSNVEEQKNIVLMYQEDLYHGMICGERSDKNGADFSSVPVLENRKNQSYEALQNFSRLFPELDQDEFVSWYLASARIGGEFRPLWIIQEVIDRSKDGAFDWENPSQDNEFYQELHNHMRLRTERFSTNELLRSLSQLAWTHGYTSKREKYSSTYTFKALAMSEIVSEIVKKNP